MVGRSLTRRLEHLEIRSLPVVGEPTIIIECVDSDREGFTQGHHGYDFLRRLMASEAVWLFGSSFSAASYSAMAACGLFWFS